MKITDLEVIRLRSPEHARPIRPAWTPGGTRTRSEAVLVRVDTDEGIVGWGAVNAQDSAAVEGWLKLQNYTNRNENFANRDLWCCLDCELPEGGKAIIKPKFTAYVINTSVDQMDTPDA